MNGSFLVLAANGISLLHHMENPHMMESGGAVKRGAVKASLQWSMEGKILSTQELFVYCDQELFGIECFIWKNQE